MFKAGEEHAIVLSNVRSFPRDTLLFSLISVQLTICFLL